MLKQELLKQGYEFPCGGVGRCGRCRICAPKCPVSALDKRFLSPLEIEGGVRLACDKGAEVLPLIKEVYLKKAAAAKKIAEPSIAVGLYDNRAEISIVDGTEVVETEMFPIEHLTTSEVRSVIGKNSVEFFEKYGGAKADVISVCGSKKAVAALLANRNFAKEPLTECEYLSAGELFLPAQEVLISPVVTDEPFLGGLAANANELAVQLLFNNRLKAKLNGAAQQ